MSIQIKQVKTPSDLKKFIMFPHKLYKDSPYWVPPIFIDERDTLNAKKNPAFKHASAEYWLAYKDEEIVGRIAGILINAEVNEKKLARFGWIDFVDDEEVSKTLIGTVEKWAKDKNLVGVHGPLGLSDLDAQGMLVEGFDTSNTMATTYNYEYYPEHLKMFGYLPSAEWVEIKGDASFEFSERDYKRTDFLKDRFKLEVLEIRKRADMLPYFDGMFELINKTYSDLYGFYPLSKLQKEYYVEKYLKLVRTDYCCMILKDKKLIGFGFGMPSFSKALQKSKGRFLPFGWFHLLKAFKNDEIIDLYLVSVDPKFVQLGVTRLIFFEMFKNMKKNKTQFVYTNPILINNIAARQLWSTPLANKDDAQVRKRRQCFLKTFTNE